MKRIRYKKLKVAVKKMEHRAGIRDSSEEDYDSESDSDSDDSNEDRAER